MADFEKKKILIGMGIAYSYKAVQLFQLYLIRGKAEDH